MILHFDIILPLTFRKRERETSRETDRIQKDADALLLAYSVHVRSLKVARPVQSRRTVRYSTVQFYTFTF